MMTSGGFWALGKTCLMLHAQDFLLGTLGRVKPGSFLQTAIQGFSKRFVGGYPAVIKLDITQRCNLRCKTCYFPKVSQDVSLDGILHILKQFHHLPIRLDILGGEPLLHKDICKIIGFAKSQTKDIFLYTNGTLADEKLAKALAGAGLGKAVVTLISHNQDKHDKFINTAGSWEQTVDGIRNLSKAGIKTYTFTALHKDNISDFDRIRDFARYTLNVHPLFYQYVPQIERDPLAVEPELWNIVKHQILYKDNPRHRFAIESILTFCGRGCLGGYYVLSIKTDGRVTPCPFIQDISIGNIFEDNLWNIFAKRLMSREFCEFLNLPQECQECSYKNLCGGGCKAGNKTFLGSYSRKDYRCLGPYTEPVSCQEMADKLPTFF